MRIYPRGVVTQPHTISPYAIVADLVAVYDVNALSASADLVAVYQVLEIASADLVATYQVRELAAADLVAVYSVAGDTAYADLVAIYSIAAPVTATLTVEAAFGYLSGDASPRLHRHRDYLLNQKGQQVLGWHRGFARELGQQQAGDIQVVLLDENSRLGRRQPRQRLLPRPQTGLPDPRQTDRQ